MLLQRLNKNDLPEIIAFNRRCFSPGDRWSGEDWTELLEDERAHYYACLLYTSSLCWRWKMACPR